MMADAAHGARRVPLSSYHFAVAEGAGGDESPSIDSLNPRHRRAQRRRRRRQLGTALFVVIVIVIFGLAYLAVAGGDSSDEATSTTVVRSSTSTTTAKTFGPYKVTAGVNVRQGPGTTFPTVGTVETGREVSVACVTNGEAVNSPTGPIAQWLKTTGSGPIGYITALYVETGDDLRTNAIPPCPS
jgi:hypothetical protein